MNFPSIISTLGLAAVALVAGCSSKGASADGELADASATDALAEVSSGPCTFSADAFDLSCTTDKDCVGVSPSYYCSPAQCGCSSITISRNALAQFNAEVARTPLGSGAVQGVDCGCPSFNEGVCCVSGTCQSICPATTSGGAEGGPSSGIDSGNDTGASDALSGGYATLCPVFGNQPTCPAAFDASGCNLLLGENCSADVLPQGIACSGTSQCRAAVGPVDGCGRVDGWICSCIDGRWACDDCAEGAAACEGGGAAYELPDSGAD